MNYAIICDARQGKNLGISHLALVDRDRFKLRWWTSDDASIILRINSQTKANRICSRFRNNNPSVVPYFHAVNLIEEQAKSIALAQNKEQADE